jgi:hypothetical protein
VIFLFGILGFGLLYITKKTWADRQLALGFLLGSALCLSAFLAALNAGQWGFPANGIGTDSIGYTADR